MTTPLAKLEYLRPKEEKELREMFAKLASPGYWYSHDDKSETEEMILEYVDYLISETIRDPALRLQK